MESQKINFFTKIYRSVTDFSFYRLVLKEPSGKAFLYLLLLSLLFGAIALIEPIVATNKGINIANEFVRNEVPYFVLADGELEVDGDMPIIYEDGSEGIIIDTTGKTDESILDEYERGVYISKYKLINKQDRIQKRVIEFSQMKDLNITKDDVMSLLPHARWIIAVILVFGIIGMFLGKLISTLLISIIGLIINAMTKAKLEYGNIYKLGIYSITLPTIIKTVINLADITIPYFFMIYYGIVVFYLWKTMIIIEPEENEFELN